MTTTLESAPAVPAPPKGGRRKSLQVGGGVLAGLVLAVVWSAALVDRSIGFSVADGVLGRSAESTAISGAGGGALFAFVSGFAGTFTACNIAVFGALPEVAARGRRRWTGPLGLLATLVAGVLAVACAYGVVAVLVGHQMPQLSSRTVGDGLPVRLVQSMVAFGAIGLAFAYLGLGALGVIRDPLARRPRLRVFVIGTLIGGFLVGRPYPLFHHLADYAVSTRNPVIGALTFGLQSVGNILLVMVVGMLFVALIRGRAGRWLAEHRRAQAIAGTVLVTLGAFLVIYWDVRLPAHFGYGWFPAMPWNT